MIRLGLRLSFGAGRAGLIRTLSMSGGAAVGVLIMLACLAAVSVAQTQHHRAEARSPVFRYEPAFPNEEAGDRPTAGLRWVEINDAVGDRPLRRIAVGGATTDSPRPPGLTAFPDPGTAVVSPALSTLIRSDPRAADRFPQRIVGTIGRAGLVAPDELRAYVGVAADDPQLVATRRQARSFGGPVDGADGGQFSTDPEAYAESRSLALGFAFFVLVPLGVFLAACAQLSASSRNRRLAALRLLGITAHQAARINAVETGAVALVGALLGALLAAVLGPLSEGWHIGRLQWYAADVELSVGWVTAVVCLVVGHAVLVGTVATRSGRVDPLPVRRNAPARRPSRWRAVPLLVALGTAGSAAVDTPVPPPARAVLVAFAMLTAAVGLALAAPLPGHWVAGLTARWRRAPVWLTVAGARLRHAPGSAHRLAMTITVAVYVAGLGAFGTVVAANVAAVPVPAGWNNELWYQLSAPRGGLVASLREIPGISVMDITTVDATIAGRPAMVLAADCADVTEMYQLAAGESCVDGRRYRLDFTRLGDAAGPPVGAPAGAPAGAPLTAGGGVRGTVPAQTLHVVRQRHSVGFSGEVLLTPAAAVLRGSAPRADTSVQVVADDRSAVDRATRLVAHRSPASSLDGDAGIRGSADEDLMATILMAGMMVTFLLGIGAFVVAVVDRAVERRRDNAALAVVGMRPGLLTLTETVYAAVPLLPGLVLAELCTVVMAVSVARVLDVAPADTLRQIAAVQWLGVVAVSIALAVIAASTRFTSRIGTAYLRRP